VVHGGVGAGIAPALQPGQGLTGGDLGAVQEAQQRMETKVRFHVAASVLLLTVRDGDRRVEVQPQLLAQIRAGARGPRPFPGYRPCRTHRAKMVGVDTVQHPPRGRHRGDRTEQVLGAVAGSGPRGACLAT